jgi:hypothetical protein
MASNEREFVGKLSLLLHTTYALELLCKYPDYYTTQLQSLTSLIARQRAANALLLSSHFSSPSNSMAPSRGVTSSTRINSLPTTTLCPEPTPSRTVPVLSSSTSYSLFRSQHLLPNTPCLFPPSQTAQWSLFGRWITPETGELDWDYLDAKYGGLEVECVECEGQGDRRGRQDDKELEAEMLDRFSDLLSLWKEGRGRRIYLKDWHLPLRVVQSAGSSIAAGREKVREELYEVDGCWLDDWMNEWEGAGRGKGAEASRESAAAGGRKEDDFRFVYAGGGNSWTWLHRDVCAFFPSFLVSFPFPSSPLPLFFFFPVVYSPSLSLTSLYPIDCSYSISTNLFGRKLWYLFPPTLTPLLKPLITAAERQGKSVNCDWWSEEEKERWRARGMMEIVQEQGETIFMCVEPSISSQLSSLSAFSTSTVLYSPLPYLSRAFRHPS